MLNEPAVIMIRFVPAELICCSTDVRAPVPIDTMLMTAATPMIMPRVVSTVRSLLRDSAISAIRSVMSIDTSHLLVGRRQRRELLRRIARMNGLLIPLDAPVPERDRAGRVLRDVGLVRDEHDREAALAVQPLEDVHHLDARARVEVARRLVGQQDRRAVDERTRDGDALLLSARELIRMVIRAST